MDLFSKLKMPPLVDQIREAGVYPYFHELQSRQDTTVIMEGKRRIMLGLSLIHICLLFYHQFTYSSNI